MPKRLAQVYLARMRQRYQNAPKALKIRILSEFCVNSGYSRKHAIRILNGSLEPRTRRPGPPEKYRPEVVHHFRFLWDQMNRVCSKNLKAALPLWLGFYRDAEQEIKQKLLKMTPSTIDEKLRPYRVFSPKGKATTRGLKAMMGKIPLKLLEGEITEPGYTEMDTVAHCGDDIGGHYTHSITLTDLASGRTENASVWTKEAEPVQKKIAEIERRLPFPPRGCAVDNGSEFMNEILAAYFQRRKKPIDFVRRRPYRKNDNAHVEQKNFTHVREIFGYERYDHFELSVMMVERFTARENAKLESRLRGARFKERAACMEDIDYKTSRGLKKQTMLELGQLRWIDKKQNVAFTGPSGTGKSYLAQALGHRACRSGYRVIYVRLPKLLTALAQSRADGFVPESTEALREDECFDSRWPRNQRAQGE